MDDQNKSPKPTPKKKQVMDISAPTEKPKIQRFGGKNTLLNESNSVAQEEEMTETPSPTATSKVIEPKSELTIVDNTAQGEDDTRNPEDVAKEIESLAQSMDTSKPKRTGTKVDVKSKKLSEFKDEKKLEAPKSTKTPDTKSDSVAEKIVVKTTPKTSVKPPEPVPTAPEAKKTDTKDTTTKKPAVSLPDEPAQPEKPAPPEESTAPEPDKPQDEPDKPAPDSEKATPPSAEPEQKPAVPPPSTGTNSSGEPSVNMQPTGFIFPKAPHVDGEANPLQEQADAAKSELQDPKIFDTKEYHVPIKVSRHNRKKSRLGSYIFWFILLVLLVGGILGLIKVGILHTSIQIPYINK